MGKQVEAVKKAFEEKKVDVINAIRSMDGTDPLYKSIKRMIKKNGKNFN